MTDHSAKTVLGLSPTRYGVASLVAACLAAASWPLVAGIGFGMVYVAILLAVAAVLSGLLGIGSGLYTKDPAAIATGALGLGIAGLGSSYVGWAMTHF